MSATMSSMAKRKKTIDTLARSLERHFAQQGMGPRELVDLACALIDQATRRVSREEATQAP
jgi:hypothetical protein